MPEHYQEWRCNKCKEVFKTEEEALKCEQSHPTLEDVKIVGITYSSRFYNKHDKYPSTIIVEFSDGARIDYD